MRVCYSRGYTIPLSHTHPFPMGKYEALYRILIEEGLIVPDDAHDPGEADWSDLALAHTACCLRVDNWFWSILPSFWL